MVLQYRNLLLANTVSQKDEKNHTAGLDDSAILHIKIKIITILQYCKPPCTPHESLFVQLAL